MTNRFDLASQNDEILSLTSYERNAVLKRIEQIAVALSDPKQISSQAAVLIRERAELVRRIAVRLISDHQSGL